MERMKKDEGVGAGNAKLERLMAELSLERPFLKDVAKGMFHDRSS
jgi:hypothetical protein